VRKEKDRVGMSNPTADSDITDETPAIREHFYSNLTTSTAHYVCRTCKQEFTFDFPRTASFGDALARIDGVLEIHMLRHEVSRKE